MGKVVSQLEEPFSELTVIALWSCIGRVVLSSEAAFASFLLRVARAFHFALSCMFLACIGVIAEESELPEVL